MLVDGCAAGFEFAGDCFVWGGRRGVCLFTVGGFGLCSLFVSLVLCLGVLLRSGVGLVFSFRRGFGLGGFVLGV